MSENQDISRELTELALAITVAGLSMVDAEDSLTGVNVRELLDGKLEDDTKVAGPFSLTLAQLSAMNITILLAALGRLDVPKEAALVVGGGVVDTMRDKTVMGNFDAVKAEHLASLN